MKATAPNGSLEDWEVREIRLRARVGESPRKLAAEFGIALSTARKILRRDTYDWVTDDPLAEPPPRVARRLEQQQRAPEEPLQEGGPVGTGGVLEEQAQAKNAAESIEDPAARASFERYLKVRGQYGLK